MATLYELAEELANFELEMDEETGEVLNLADLDKVEMPFFGEALSFARRHDAELLARRARHADFANPDFSIDSE